MKWRRRLLFFVVLSAVVCCSVVVVQKAGNSVAYRLCGETKYLSYEACDSFFVSMHSLESYAEEDFHFFKGVDVCFAEYEIQNLRQLSRFLYVLYHVENCFERAYLDLDPVMLLRNSEETVWGERFKELLFGYIEEHPEMTFEVVLSSPSLQHWLSMEEKEVQEALNAYSRLISELSEYENVLLYFVGMEYWLIANQDNYTDDDFQMNEIVSQKLFLYTFCDGNYRITEDNAERVLQTLEDEIRKEKEAPTQYPDLSRCNIVYFGDSILAYVRGSYSVSGCITAFSGAAAWDCSVSGTAATEAFEEMAERFAAGEAGITWDGYSASSAAEEDKTLVFVINYGLNDYFSGYPLENEEGNSYAGSLRRGIEKLQKAFPEAVILLMTPTYSALFEGGTQIQKEGSGMLTDYVDVVSGVAEEKKVYCLDNYHTFGLNRDTVEQYTTDGTHLNEYGRLAFARHIMEALEKIVLE